MEINGRKLSRANILDIAFGTVDGVMLLRSLRIHRLSDIEALSHIAIATIDHENQTPRIENLMEERG